MSIDEIVQRVTEHILDEEKKKKVSVSFRSDKMFYFILIYSLSVRVVSPEVESRSVDCRWSV